LNSQGVPEDFPKTFAERKNRVIAYNFSCQNGGFVSKVLNFEIMSQKYVKSRRRAREQGRKRVRSPPLLTRAPSALVSKLFRKINF